jgi:DNA-binding transcriptional regulator YhcF (GntR family)
VSGRGTFVKAEDVSKLVSEKRRALIEEYKEKTIEMKTSGISKELILKIIENIFKQ